MVALVRTIPYGSYYPLNWSIRLRLVDISHCSISLATLQYFSLRDTAVFLPLMSAAAFHGFTLLCREAQTVSRSTPETPFVLYYSQTRNTSNSFKPFFQENTLKYFYEYFIDIKICQILNHVQTHSQREKRCHFFCSYFFCHSSLIFSNMKHEESSRFFDSSAHNSGHHPNFFASNIQPKHSALKIKVHWARNILF